MPNGVFNIAKGRVAELANRVNANDPTNSALIVVLLKAAEADGTLEDYDDLGALLGAAGNTEADYTGANYARKTLTDASGITVTTDDTGNEKEVAIGDQTFAGAGGTVTNSLVKMLVCYDDDTGAGTDANIIPLVHLDISVTTDGSDLVFKQDPEGFFKATN